MFPDLTVMLAAAAAALWVKNKDLILQIRKQNHTEGKPPIQAPWMENVS